MIYFDNSATSPIDQEVYEAMLPYLQEEYGNPSSKYYCKAINAKNAVEDAREKVAKLINAKAEEIIFTAGATESTNFILKGYTDYEKYYGSGENHIITSLAEHSATLNTCKYLNGEIYSNNDPKTALFGANKKVDRGFEVTFLGVDSNGKVSTDVFKKAIKDSTVLASFLYVNNEVGTINDIPTISEICRERKIALHVDATQAIGKMKIDVGLLGQEIKNTRGLRVEEAIPLYMSFSAHKIYGPKGVGAAFMRNDNYGLRPISAYMHGGEQENGVRGGTLAVHNIVGFGKAAEIATKSLESDIKKIHMLDEYLLRGIKTVEELSLTIPPRERLSGIISVIVNKTDFNNERFIKQISDELALSTGSACSAGKPSYVLSAMGLGEKVNRVLRITINKYTSNAEIDRLIKVLKMNI